VEVIPAIDLRDGRCVRLIQGDYNRELVFSDDPLATAQRWEREGAPRLHVVDLDGAREGRPVNDDAVRNIIEGVELPVEVAGGVRDLGAVQRWIDAGADRVVLGSAAVRDPSLAGKAAQRFGECVLISIDARDGLVATEGWTEASELRAEDLLRQLAALGVARFVYTDIARDGTLTSPSFEAVESLVNATSAPVIAAGGVAAVEHLVQLAKLGCEGAIVGLALYDGRVDLAEALRAVEESTAG
jgi:phosphoribosylformimino-5-aminoimidazole carboxamide ribotide isomerase